MCRRFFTRLPRHRYAAAQRETVTVTAWRIIRVETSAMSVIVTPVVEVIPIPLIILRQHRAVMLYMYSVCD